MTTINFTRRSKFGLLLCVAAILMFLAPRARADEDRDPPTRVARMSVVDGSVSLQPGGQGDWGAAARNRPVTIGDKIWVDKDSRAELQAGQAAFHLGSMTAFSFLNLDEGITQVRVAEGSLNFRVRELRQGDVYEIDAPNLAFTVKEAGAFRIDVSEAGDSSRVTVIRGFGEVSAGGQNYDVHAGESAEFEGAENPTYSITRAPGPDGLDRWAEERDLREDRSASGNYVSREMPGYDDLDEYGSWRDEPEYGHVWYPSDMPPDWAPYGYGNWNWVDPWGWSWVGYEPWGFAPYHYGRWAYIGGAWGWCPGPFYGPPVYGPAFVGFFGGGWGWGFGAGFGVGWFPLGWGEPFFPWFGCSHNFVNIINVHNTVINNVNILNNNTNVHNINFVNSHNIRAVTTASRSSFMNGERINRGTQHITQSTLNGLKATNSVGIRPTQHSTLGAANFHSGVHQPPAGVQNRAVVARTTPAPAASHSPVRALNNGATNAGRFGNGQVHGSASANAHAGNSSVNGSARGNGSFENRPGNAQANSGLSARQRELSQNRPPSATGGSNHSINGSATNNSAQRPGNNTRTWEAQGNTTDHGRAPQGFGSSNRPTNTPSQGFGSSNHSANAPAQNSPRTMNDRPQGFGGSNHPSNAPAQNSARNYSDRPPWAGSGRSGSNSAPARPSTPNYNSSRPNYSNSGRSYEPPQRSSPPSGNRGYSQQPSYSPPRSSSPRTYSAPSRSYPAPSRSAPSYSYSPPSRSAPSYGYSAPRSYSPPSRSYGGGGSYAYHGGGSYSGGGGSHGGGGYSGGGSHGGSFGGGGSHGSGEGGGSHGGGGGHPHR